jgi:hypothetical protein
LYRLEANSVYSGDFANHNLLNLIEDGKISLLRAPPLQRSALEHDDPIIEWASLQMRLIPLQTRSILEACLTEMERSNIGSAGIETEISRDIRLMQVQPKIMDEYRRYVVIKGPNDNMNWDKDGVSLSFFPTVDCADMN